MYTCAQIVYNVYYLVLKEVIILYMAEKKSWKSWTFMIENLELSDTATLQQYKSIMYRMTISHFSQKSDINASPVSIL